MIWILAMTAIFGPLVVPSVMGVLVWIERSKHNAQTKQPFPEPTDWWRRRSSTRLSTAKVAASSPRHFRPSDTFNCPGMLSLGVCRADCTCAMAVAVSGRLDVGNSPNPLRRLVAGPAAAAT